MTETTQRSVMTTETHPEESGPAWWNPWHWPAGIWVLVVGAFVAMLPFGIRMLILAGVPAMDEPFDIAEFVKWDVSAEEDAFTQYRRAADLRTRLVADLKVQFPKEPENDTAVFEKGWSEADEPLKKWLQAHREALTVWRRGTEKEHALNLSPDKLAIDSVIDTIQDQRQFTRLALLESARCIDAGELDEAWRWARAAQRCGGHVTHRGCLIQGLVGVAIHATSSDGLARWAEQSGVTSEQLRAALAATKSNYDLYESRSNILKSEYLACRHTLISGKWLGLINDAKSAAVFPVIRGGLWVVGEPELTLRIFRQVLANQIREIDKPVASRRKIVSTGIAMLFDPDPAVPMLPNQLHPAEIDRGVKQSFLMRLLAPALAKVDMAMLRQEARQAVLEVLLAAQAYRRDRGEFPETLSLLVPDYLNAVPLDPCDPAGGLLLYRRDDPLDAVVWSLGDDRTDGGGDVISANNNSRPADTGFVLKVAK